MRVVLRRFCCSPMGTFGRLSWGDQIAYTVERPWLNNEPNRSCIPVGTYQLRWHTSPKYGRTLAVEGEGVSLYRNAHDRWGILIHPANLSDQLQGCIAPGEKLGCMRGQWAVLDSRRATERFLDDMRGHYRTEFEIRFEMHP